MEDLCKAMHMMLNQCCVNPEVIKRIDELVLNANRIMFEAYAFANLHVIRLLQEAKHIPKLD